MKPVVFYSINEGVFFWNGQHGVMVDYLFDNLVTAWSDMPDSTHRRMLERSGEFSREHTLLFTHSHPDHYSQKHVREYMQLYSSSIYGTGVPESNLIPVSLGPGEALLELPGCKVFIIQAEHQGRGDKFRVENSVLCVVVEGNWYLHLGDSVLDDALLTKLERCGMGIPEAVFANYYHIIPEDQRDFLKRLHARHTFGIHFPFEENDEYHIKLRLTKFLKNGFDPFLKEIVVPEPMSRIL